MKKIALAALALLLFAGLALAGGGLNGFLDSVNIQARADMDGFSARLGAQFGVPEAQVRMVIGSVRQPADAFMCLQLGQWTHRQPEEVVRVYKANRGKGWGVIAKSMGIKPGSAEFHALKRGDLSFTGQPAGEPGYGPGQGKGKGKGRGHNR